MNDVLCDLNTNAHTNPDAPIPIYPSLIMGFTFPFPTEILLRIHKWCTSSTRRDLEIALGWPMIPLKFSPPIPIRVFNVRSKTVYYTNYIPRNITLWIPIGEEGNKFYSIQRIIRSQWMKRPDGTWCIKEWEPLSLDCRAGTEEITGIFENYLPFITLSCTKQMYRHSIKLRNHPPAIKFWIEERHMLPTLRQYKTLYKTPINYRTRLLEDITLLHCKKKK